MQPAQQQEINETLSSFGLSEKDQTVYLHLLTLGTTTLTPLAHQSHLPLTTVQSIVSRLTQKGLVVVTKNKSRHVYTAHDPIIFKDILKEQITSLASIVPLLQSLQSNPTTQTRIRVFERARVTEILNESLKCQSKIIYEIVAARPFQQLIGEKYHYSTRRVREKIALKSLRIRSQEIKKYSATTHRKELREARFLPPDMTFEASILFWDNTVALLSTKSEGVHLLIESPSLRTCLQQIFDLLWSVSGKMETA